MALPQPPRWTRSDGTPVPIQLLNFPELIAAHQLLESGDWSAEDTQLLLSAIEAELALRWRQKTADPRAESKPREDDGTSRAA